MVYAVKLMVTLQTDHRQTRPEPPITLNPLSHPHTDCAQKCSTAFFCSRALLWLPNFEAAWDLHWWKWRL